jgi:hypothetical protein
MYIGLIECTYFFLIIKVDFVLVAYGGRGRESLREKKERELWGKGNRHADKTRKGVENRRRASHLDFRILLPFGSLSHFDLFFSLYCKDCVEQTQGKRQGPLAFGSIFIRSRV